VCKPSKGAAGGGKRGGGRGRKGRPPPPRGQGGGGETGAGGEGTVDKVGDGGAAAEARVVLDVVDHLRD
jgi:hypothetical protein